VIGPQLAQLVRQDFFEAARAGGKVLQDDP
jgi:hypothetical protein